MMQSQKRPANQNKKKRYSRTPGEAPGWAADTRVRARLNIPSAGAEHREGVACRQILRTRRYTFSGSGLLLREHVRWGPTTGRKSDRRYGIQIPTRLGWILCWKTRSFMVGLEAYHSRRRKS